MTIGAGGVKRPISLERVAGPVPGEQVMDPKVARELVQMMEQVVEKGGTATRASLIGYRVSGKTGTAFKSIAGGYSTSDNSRTCKTGSTGCATSKAGSIPMI